MYITLAIMFIVFFAGSFQLFAAGTYGVTYLDVFTLIFYIQFFVKTFFTNYEFKIPKSVIWTAIGFFFLSIIFSGIAVFFRQEATHLQQFMKTAVHFFFLMLLILISLAYPLKLSAINNLIRMWLIISIIINVFGVYQIFARAFNLPLAWLEYNNINMTLRGVGGEDVISQLSLKFGNFYRATSVFSEPSALATFNCYILIMLTCPFFQGTKNFFKSKRLNITIFVSAVVGSLLSFSLTALLGLSVYLFFVMIFESRKTKVLLTSILAATIILLAVTDTIVYSYTDTSVIGLFNQRVTAILNWNSKFKKDTDGESFGSRMESAQNSYIIWKDYPVFGIGFGLTQYNREVDMSFADYSILAALIELGAVGAFAFAGIFAALTFTAYRAMKYAKKIPELDDTRKRLYGLVFYLLLIQIEINFITGNNLVSPNLWLVILFITAPLYHYLIETKPYISFKLFNKKLIGEG